MPAVRKLEFPAAQPPVHLQDVSFLCDDEEGERVRAARATARRGWLKRLFGPPEPSR